MSSRKSVEQYPREQCYFCGSEGPIETHHILPQRHGGSDTSSNLVDLCPTCHERIERLYTDTVWENFDEQTGVDKPDGAEKVMNIITQEYGPDFLEVDTVVTICENQYRMDESQILKCIAYYDLTDRLGYERERDIIL